MRFALFIAENLRKALDAVLCGIGLHLWSGTGTEHMVGRWPGPPRFRRQCRLKCGRPGCRWVRLLTRLPSGEVDFDQFEELGS